MTDHVHTAAPQRFHPWRALYSVMTEPGATFAALAERPAILPPYLVQMAVGAISFAVIWPLTWAASMDQMAKLPTQPPSLQTVKAISMASGLFGVLVSPWIVGLIVAAIAAFLGQFYGGNAGFKAYFSMAGYARSPLAVSMLVGTAMMAGATTLQQARSMSISLAVFAPDANPYIKGVLATINPFDLFYYVLLAIGFAALQRMKPEKGKSLAVIVYLLGLAVSVFSHVMAARQGF